MMSLNDIKELTGYLQFEHLPAFEKVITYGDIGRTFYILMKGLCSVQVPNPAIDGWKLRYREYNSLKQWKESFDEKVEKAKNDNYEDYQAEVLESQEAERYEQTKTRVSLLGALDARSSTVADPSSPTYSRIVRLSKEEREKIEMREGDKIFKFDFSKFLSISNVERANLELLKKYDEYQWFVEVSHYTDG